MSTTQNAHGASIEVQGLTKIYKSRGKTVTAVDNLDLTVGAGEFFSLLGVNGAGKTTTIKMLSCLSVPSAGTARIGGFDIGTQADKVRQIINVSPQNTAVALNLTVRENLELTAGLWGAAKADARTATDRVIAELGLGKTADSLARTLSGGWQRRLSIAMALITEPSVLFLDEPTLGLDVLARRELWNVIRELKGRVTVILTTHYLEEAEALSDRIGIMADGQLHALGTVSELCALTGKDRFEDAFVEIVSGSAGKGED